MSIENSARKLREIKCPIFVYQPKMRNSINFNKQSISRKICSWKERDVSVNKQHLHITVLEPSTEDTDFKEHGIMINANSSDMI